MAQSEELFDNIKTVLRKYPRLRFDDGSSSATGEEMEAVRLSFIQILGWKPDPGTKAGNLRVMNAASNAQWPKGWRDLEALINDPRQQDALSFQRRDPNGGFETDLYILVPFGLLWYVGIRTRLINA